MSHEKSQLENMTLPVAGGSAGKKETPSGLPAGFSLGQQLIAKDKPTPRAETLKHFLPNYPGKLDRVNQEEKKIKARVEREGMNYDLYSLIKEKLAGEFGDKLHEELTYQNLKKTSLFDYIKDNPQIYTPNEKDLIYIANNLQELLVDQKVYAEYYPMTGIFLNSFIHAYFNSVPEEKRKDLKLNLPNTKDLHFIGSELSFGELKVEEAGNYFGRNAHGSAVLRASKTGDSAGQEVYGHAQILLQEAGLFVGGSMHGDAKIRIGKKYGSIGGNKKDNSQIILPDGRVLMPGDFA